MPMVRRADAFDDLLMPGDLLEYANIARHERHARCRGEDAKQQFLSCRSSAKCHTTNFRIDFRRAAISSASSNNRRGKMPTLLTRKMIAQNGPLDGQRLFGPVRASILRHAQDVYLPTIKATRAEHYEERECARHAHS